MTTPKPLSQRAYAKLRGVSHSAVARAISEGRLETSLTTNAQGHKKIISAELANAEWEANTRPDADQRAEDDAAQGELPDEKISLKEARRRREIETLKLAKIQAEHQRLDLAERNGDLMSRSEMLADVAEEFAHVRTKLMGIPLRCKQRIPGLTNADVKVIDALVREALENLADGN
jgi:phage terminase Nu1 subunit (DNA packaging protein)